MNIWGLILMYIKSLQLTGYKRFLLSRINTLIITPDNFYQIILGSNGCGKSSLLKELSPLPGNQNDFIKGGLKSIEIEHNGDAYILTSSFTGKATHSFIRNGEEELNDGGTITVQRELVKREFGITEELHDFMSGNLTFTRMSASKRREFITSMADTDLVYAMGVYKKIATIARDNQGAIKHLQSRISKESESLQHLSVEDNLEEVVLVLQEELSIMMDNRQPNLPSMDSVTLELEEALNKANRISDSVLSNPFYQSPYKHFNTMNEVVDAVNDLKVDVNVKRNLLDKSIEEYDKFNVLMTSIELAGTDDIIRLNEKADELNANLKSLKSKESVFTFDGDVTTLGNVANTIKTLLVDVLSVLPDNSDLKYSNRKLAEAEENITTLRSTINSMTSKCSKISSDMENILEAKESKCPKCNYVWKEGISDDELLNLKALVAKHEKVAENATEELTEILLYREEALDYISLYNKFKAIADSYPKADNLFYWFLENGKLQYAPSQHIPIIDRWILDLSNANERWHILQELDIINTTIKNVENYAGTADGQLKESVTDIEDTVKSLTSELIVTKESLNSLNGSLNSLKVYDVAKDELTDLIDSISKNQIILYHCIRSKKLNDVIRSHQSSLALKVNRLQERKTLESIIADLNESLVEVESSHNSHKLLMKALSPTDGEIAQQMTKFISCMVAQMNMVIEQIYTYPLQILPCDIEFNALDYKFPLSTGEDDDNPAPDVSKGSTGQQEIVDFAFKLVSLLYLGLTNFPLYVDELGHHFDEQHHTNVMTYIKQLVETNRHSQLFMVSHYASQHEAFTNADFIVLNDSNITVPAKYNTNVTII